MRLLSIASGSSGNCIYVGDDTTHILIDAGISGKRIEAGLQTVGISGKDLDAIFVTHEHIDHISGLGVMARKFDVPIYSTSGTIRGIACCKSVGDIDEQLYQTVRRNENKHRKTGKKDPIARKQRIFAIIAIILVVAMVVPLIMSMMI